MSTLLKTTSMIGAIMTLVGSFLPWQREGDLVSFWFFGIRILPSIKDNGGLLVIVLTLATVYLISQPSTFAVKRVMWGVVFSISLFLVSIFHVYQAFVMRSNAKGIIGAPEIQIGLVMVFIGSLLLLIQLYFII